MATIQLPITVMDEKCAGCQCLNPEKKILYSGPDEEAVKYMCRNLHMCTYIKNRIVRGEEKKETKEDKNEQ